LGINALEKFNQTAAGMAAIFTKRFYSNILTHPGHFNFGDRAKHGGKCCFGQERIKHRDCVGFLGAASLDGAGVNNFSRAFWQVRVAANEPAPIPEKTWLCAGPVRSFERLPLTPALSLGERGNRRQSHNDTRGIPQLGMGEQVRWL
jgi:hypothetical protein